MKPSNTSLSQGVSTAIILVAVAVVAAAAAGAYYFYTHRSGVVSTQDGQVVKYAQNANEVNITDSDATLTTGDNVKLPQDFPKDIPVYPGAKISTYMYELPDALLMQTSKDDTSKIMDWYRTAFQKEGWVLEMEAGPSMTVTKGELASGLGISENGDGTNTITVSVFEKSELGFSTMDGQEDFDAAMQEGKEMLEKWQEDGLPGADTGTVYDNE